MSEPTIEELKRRLKTLREANPREVAEYGQSYRRAADYMLANADAILAEREAMRAKLEAAQRSLQNCLYATSRKADRDTALADAVRRFCKEAGVEPQTLRDKETA